MILYNEISPKVSICVPVFNNEKTLSITLKSILSQTFTDFQLIIRDNASTDSSYKIAERFARLDNRIILLRANNTCRMEENVEILISKATGDYTAVFHSDDVYSPVIIEQEVNFLNEHQECAAVFSNGNIIDSFGNFLKNYQLPNIIFEKEHCIRKFNIINFLPILFQYGNFLICPTAMVRTNIYKNLPTKWTDKKFASAADLGVWCGIMEKYYIGIISKKLISIRSSSTQYSARVNFLNTERNNLFLVTDYYSSWAKSKGIISNNDLRLLALQHSKDFILRAHNSLILGNYLNSKKLFEKGLEFSLKNIYISLKNHNYSYLKWLLLGNIANILILVGLSGIYSSIVKKRWYPL
jgi:glycosyltransferase involved in cell wall biosynthesis